MPHAARSLTAPERTSLDEDTSTVDLVERALDGARELAAREATLAVSELEADARRVGRVALLAMVSVVLSAIGLAWAGVALAWALGAGASGLAVAACVASMLAGAIGLVAKNGMPSTLLEKSRARLEKRAARVAESMR